MKYMKLKIFAPVAFIWLLAITSVAIGQKKDNLSDPQVAFVAVTANQIDIDYANIALKKSKNDEIVNFAKTMVNDHQAIIKQASDLVKKLGVTPAANTVSSKMLSDAVNTRKQLNTKNAHEFDKAYISNEVSYHKSVIDAVENVLIPESENTELKNLLVGVVPALKEHLAHAEMIQSKMK